MFLSSFHTNASLRLPVASFVLLIVSLLVAHSVVARAQAIGAHRGDVAGTGGTRSIQGRIISPLGRLPETRIRVTLESSNSGSRTVIADADGSFNFNSLESGPYQITIDAGKEYETARESVYIEGAKPIYNIPVYLRMKPEANPALAGVPKAAVDLYLKALEAARKGEGKKGIEQLKEAVTLHPRFGLAHAELGVQYMKANQMDKAVEALESAIKLMPDDPTVNLNYGIALLEKKDYAKAEKHLREALKKLDSSATAHMYLGMAVLRTGKQDEAEKELVRAIKLGGNAVAPAHYYLGGIYWGKKDFKRAADELETYLRLRPNAPDAERLRATIKDLRSKQ